MALVDRNTYANAPDITIELRDHCPPGGGVQTVMTATRHALKYRMRIFESNMSSAFWGRCLKVRVSVTHATEPFLFYAVDGFYTTSRIYHDASLL